MDTLHTQPSFLGNNPGDNDILVGTLGDFDGDNFELPQPSMNTVTLTEQQRQAFFALQGGNYLPQFSNNWSFSPRASFAHEKGTDNLFGQLLCNGYRQPENLSYFNGFDNSNNDPSNLGFNIFDGYQPNFGVPMANDIPALPMGPVTENAQTDHVLQGNEVSDIQNASLSMTPETQPLSGEVIPLNIIDFETFSEHTAVPAESSEVTNDKAVTPPELIKESHTSQSDSLTNDESQRSAKDQVLPTSPGSNTSNSPDTTSTPLGPIRNEKKTKSARKEAQTPRKRGFAIMRHIDDDNEEKRARATGLTIGQYRAEVKTIKKTVVDLYLKRVDPEVISSEEPLYECNYANCTTIGTRRRIAEHIQVVHLGRRPLCNACGMKSARSDVYTKHLNKCKTCSYCKKQYDTPEERKECQCFEKEWDMTLSEFGLGTIVS